MDFQTLSEETETLGTEEVSFDAESGKPAFFEAKVAFLIVLSGVVSARGEQLCRVGVINLFQSLIAESESI
jgi:hypothetical protein